jgi:uncharacterized protein (DUF2252 family)
MSDAVRKIIDFNRGVDEHLLDLKYSFMQENIFRFFRGSNHLFYEEWSKYVSKGDSPLTWICGDLHIENFGSYKGENRLVYFDINDFDEAALAPASWEIVRTVSSIFTAFDALDIENEKALRMAWQFLKSYAATLKEGRSNYVERATATGIIADFLNSAAKRKYKHLLEKRTKVNDGSKKFRYGHERHEKLDKQLRKRLLSRIEAWIRSSDEGPYNFRAKDVVFRIAGTGSVGLKRFVFLLKSTNKKDKFLLLDMKQVRKSCLFSCLPTQPNLGTEAEFIITVQKRMQNVAPALLSSITFDNDLYLLQEMQPQEDNIDFRLIKDNYRNMFHAIDTMGMLVASAQLRSSGRNGSATADELIGFGASDNWRRYIIEYAQYNRNKIQKDFENFLEFYMDSLHKTGRAG